MANGDIEQKLIVLAPSAVDLVTMVDSVISQIGAAYTYDLFMLVIYTLYLILDTQNTRQQIINKFLSITYQSAWHYMLYCIIYLWAY